jgi:hypothetical protein
MARDRVLTVYLSESKIVDLFTVKYPNGTYKSIYRDKVFDDIEAFLDENKIKDAFRLDNINHKFLNKVSQKAVIFKFALKPNLQYDYIQFVAKQDKLVRGDERILDKLVSLGHKEKMRTDANIKFYKTFAKITLAIGIFLGGVKVTPQVQEVWKNWVLSENYNYLFDEYIRVNDQIEDYYAGNPRSNMNNFGIVYHNPEEEAQIKEIAAQYLEQQEIDPRAKDLWIRFKKSCCRRKTRKFH